MKLSKKHYVIGGLALLAVAAVTVSPDLAMAQGTVFNTSCQQVVNGTGGDGLLKDIINVITGPLGATIGLVISLFGAYQWLVNQSNWGIVILAGGALLTAFPNVYVNLLEGLCNVLPSTTQAGG